MNPDDPKNEKLLAKGRATAKANREARARGERVDKPGTKNWLVYELSELLKDPKLSASGRLKVLERIEKLSPRMTARRSTTRYVSKKRAEFRAKNNLVPVEATVSEGLASRVAAFDSTTSKLEN